MISQVYLVACDICRKNMQILKANGIGSAFKAVKKLPWRRNHNNMVHECPECIAKIKVETAKPAEGCEVTAGDMSKEIKSDGK